jgi:hypothetical protein
MRIVSSKARGMVPTFDGRFMGDSASIVYTFSRAKKSC